MRLTLDRWILAAFLIACLFLLARLWLHEHPEHNPWAPLHIDHPWGWATAGKISELRRDTEQCRAFMRRSDIDFEALPPAGKGGCRREDRLLLEPDREAGLVLSPRRAEASCPVHAGLALWLRHGVQPAAESGLGSRVVRIEHLGTYACRRVGSGRTGRWSEHATGNAIDIAAFALADGRRLSILRDWNGTSEHADFLRDIRDSACEVFGTVLSPEYNAAHADHLHLDQATRGAGWSYCR